MKSAIAFAFAMLVILGCAPQVSAQQDGPRGAESIFLRAAQNEPQRKDPGTAALLSALWPGLGQRYNGETAKGTRFALAAGASLALTLYVVQNPAEKTTNVGGFDVVEASLNPLIYVGYAALLGTFIYSIADAVSTAERLNRERGLAAEIGPRLTPNGRVSRILVALRIRF